MLIIFVLIISFRRKESFTTIQSKGCLITKKLTSEGGRYNFKVIDDVNQIDTGTSIFKPFTNEFTKEMCNGDYLGSGRKTGFECIDFVTEKEAKKYDLKFSKKTCYDNLDYVSNLQYTV